MRRGSSELSLIATMVFSEASSAKVSGLMSDAIHDRVVVDHDRQVAGAGDGTEVMERLARVGGVDHARQHHQPVDADLGGVLGVLRGFRGGELGDPRQDRDAAVHHFLGGARAPCASRQARREQFSPTVPSMMKPWTPPWIRRSISFWVAGMFRLSSALNWVVTAGKTPFHCGGGPFLESPYGSKDWMYIVYNPGLCQYGPVED